MATTNGWRYRPRDGQRFPVRITDELHTIEYNSDWNGYGFQLSEAPALTDSGLTAPIMQIVEYDTSTATYTEVSRNIEPGPGKYTVDYDDDTYLATGRVQCSSANANTMVLVTYWGCGKIMSLDNLSLATIGIKNTIGDTFVPVGTVIKAAWFEGTTFDGVLNLYTGLNIIAYEAYVWFSSDNMWYRDDRGTTTGVGFIDTGYINVTFAGTLGSGNRPYRLLVWYKD